MKEKNKLKPNIRFKIKRFSGGIGWFSGELFSLFKFTLFEIHKGPYENWILLFELHIAKFTIELLWDEEGSK